jgi:hypothetical protein
MVTVAESAAIGAAARAAALVWLFPSAEPPVEPRWQGR